MLFERQKKPFNTHLASSSNSKRDSSCFRMPDTVIVSNNRERPVRPASSAYSSCKSYSFDDERNKFEFQDE